MSLPDPKVSKTFSRPKRKLAVALGHRQGIKDVPTVMASGQGEMARSILRLAKEQGLTIEENSDLAQVLVNLNLGDSIPEEIFAAVAEILFYVYEINSGLKEGRAPRLEANSPAE